MKGIVLQRILFGLVIAGLLLLWSRSQSWQDRFYGRILGTETIYRFVTEPFGVQFVWSPNSAGGGYLTGHSSMDNRWEGSPFDLRLPKFGSRDLFLPWWMLFLCLVIPLGFLEYRSRQLRRSIKRVLKTETSPTE